MQIIFVFRYFGQNCNQVCKCKNFARCRKNDGYCICNDGWMGTHCEDVCPEGSLLETKKNYIFEEPPAQCHIK